VQRLLFSRIEGWIVILLGLVGFLLAISFGSIILLAEREGRTLGGLGPVAVGLAEVPLTAERLLKTDRAIMVSNQEDFIGKPDGWSAADGARLPEGLILLSRYDGDRKRHVIDLYSLADQTLRWTWVLDPEALLEGITPVSGFSDVSNWDGTHFRAIHPLLLENGDLIVKDHYSPVFRISPCGTRLWKQDTRAFHHATEVDAEGDLWIPGIANPPTLDRIPPDFGDDTLTRVSKDGEILAEYSVAGALVKIGLARELFGMNLYNPDPIHLNDIEPALSDGATWKKGDLFLSMRNISMIALYRPSEERIVWTLTGPWLNQHDVDIVDGNRIAIFNNNAQDRGSLPYFETASNIVIHDFATGDDTTLLADEMLKSRIRTGAAGLFTQLPGGFSLIEDVSHARMIIFDASGAIAAEFTNRAGDGEIYHLGWSRFVDPDLGAKVLANLQKVTCDA
jgi:Arylsulfotransferase (ASST)